MMFLKTIFSVMDKETWQKILEICDKLSNVTYENLTKIIRLEQTGDAAGARKLDDSNQNDVDTWMGGGTCFSMTWHLYESLSAMGLKPRLVMGHKRIEKNTHCALVLSVNENFNTTENYLFDPGYLIFKPLLIPFPKPFGNGQTLFPLVPNCVRLVRSTFECLELWTGGAIQENGKLSAPMKLRFEYPLEGVSVAEFKEHWNESFYKEMMTYPVLNKLDTKKQIQYYYQKGNLVIRDSKGSKMERIEESQRVETLSKIFNLSPEIIEKAFGILSK